jgi:hypothetical protein
MRQNGDMAESHPSKETKMKSAREISNLLKRYGFETSKNTTHRPNSGPVTISTSRGIRIRKNEIFVAGMNRNDEVMMRDVISAILTVNGLSHRVRFSSIEVL